jgi:FAD/FMN-containing dehydrogenase
VPIDCRENWSRNVAFNPRCRYQPKDESEVLRILADHPKGPIRVVGSCHSMNDIAKSSEVWIDMTQYKADWKWDLDGTPPTVTVPAGVTLEALQKALAERGKTLPARGTIKKQTIAGAISTGTHGSGNRSLSSFVTRMHVAAYEGGNPKASVIRSEQDLRAARTALGAIGVILDVTLEVSSAYFIEENLDPVATLAQVRGPGGKSEDEYPMQLFVRFPYHWGYGVSRRRVVDRGPQGAWETLKSWRRWAGNRVVKDGLLPWIIKSFVAEKDSGGVRRFYNEFLPGKLQKNDPVRADDDRVQTMRHEWFPNQDIELFVPASRFEAADQWLKDMIEAFDKKPEVPAKEMVDSLKAAGFWEAFEACGRYTVHAPLFYQRVMPDDNTLISMTAGATEPYYSIIALSYRAPGSDNFEQFAAFIGKGLVQRFGARPHWGKFFPFDAQDVQRAHPKLADFRAACLKYDPNGVFRNEFIKRVLP